MQYAYLNNKNLGNCTLKEIKETLQNIPENFTGVILSRNELWRKSGVELNEALRGLPPYITYVNLSHNDFWKSRGSALRLTLQGLPLTVTHVCIHYNGLWHKTGAELKEILQGLSSKVTSVDLSYNALWRKKGEEFKEALQGLPYSVTHVNLKNNEFCSMRTSLLKLALQGLPLNVTHVDLSENELGSKTAAELKEALQGLHPNVTNINLSTNELVRKTGEELSEIFQGLSSGVKIINLSNNVLLRINLKWKEALQKLPSNITHVDLSGNELGFNSEPATLKEILQYLPPNVTYVNLSANELWRQKGYFLENALKYLPSKVIRVDLSNNGFLSKGFTVVKASDLKETLQGLSLNVKHVELGYNCIGHHSPTALRAIFNNLPSNIRSINLSGNGLYEAVLVAILESLGPEVSTVIADKNGVFSDKSIQETEASFKRINAAKHPSTTLTLANNGYSLQSRTLPFFLAGHCGFFRRQKDCSLKNVPQELIEKIYSFLHGEMNYLKKLRDYRVKYLGITIFKTTLITLDLLLLLKSAQPLDKLKRLLQFAQESKNDGAVNIINDAIVNTRLY